MSFNRDERTSIGSMVQGFGGMLTYYFMIGAVLLVAAVCCGGPLALNRWLASDSDATAERAPRPLDDRMASTNRPDDRTPEWMRPFVGDYSRHGQTLRITPDGRGTYRSRSYVACGEPGADQSVPCEDESNGMPMRIEFTLVQTGGGALARVGTANTGDSGDMPITIVKPGIVDFNSLQFCNGDVVPVEENRETCGA